MKRRTCASVITRRTLVSIRDRLNERLMYSSGQGYVMMPTHKLRHMVAALNNAIIRETPKGPNLPAAPFD